LLRFGSESRNTIIGPGWRKPTWGSARIRVSARTIRFNLQFRWEAFNFFNRANFNQPAVVVNVASPAFGSITLRAAREKCQFGLKLNFEEPAVRSVHRFY